MGSIREILSYRLRLARYTLSLTRKEAASKIGIHPQYLLYIELKKKTPSLDVIEKISHAYGIPHYWFFLPEGVEDIVPVQVHIASSNR